ncbi:MAG: TonB-dependent receptor [Leptonema illini]|uniref:TonB-dependent receptor n=1 Tax=Leptonema illini TaxID=183 RepID=A0A833H1V4_9LEPT|nr:MAG: TonB-dependent receptor [Leptonema illini]
MKRINKSILSPFRIALSCLVLFALFPGALSAFELRLRVLDSKQNPVADAQIIVIETRQKAFTDNLGEAVVEIPAPGFYTFRTILPDGTLLQPRLQVQAPGQRLTVYASPPQRESDVVEQQTQTVTGGDGVRITGRKEKQNLSRYTVRLDEIKRIPGQFGEALRGIENLPGTNAPPFGNGDIVLRGANENANTYLFDDLPIGYPFHLLGLNSVVQNDIIKSIDIYNGAYPVRFGDATGGIIAIESIDEVKKLGGHTTFSLWSSSVLLKGPIQSGADGYIIAGARLSYLDQTLKPYIPSGVELIPRYGDAQFKIRFDLTEKQTLYFYALGAQDTFIAAIERKPSWDPTSEPPPELIGASIAINRAFNTEALRHIWQPTGRIYSESTLLYHNNITYLDGTIGIYNAKFRTEDGYAGFRNESSFELLKDHITLETGVEARRFRYMNRGTTLRNNDPTSLNNDFFDETSPNFSSVTSDDLQYADYHSGYAMLVLRFWRLELKPGGRIDHFGLTRQTARDPRGTVAFKITDSTTLTAGAGVYHRVPDPDQYSATSGNPDLKMEKAVHQAAGIEHRWKSWTFRLEGFRQFYTDMVVEDALIRTPYKENPDPVGKLSQPVLTNAPLYFSNDGEGYSDGFEVFIKRDKKPDANGLYGWISYTWSRSLRNDHQPRANDPSVIWPNEEERQLFALYDNGKMRYADFDRRHIINIILGYKVNREWQIGGKWRYTTSTPYTNIVGDDGGKTQNDGRPIFQPVYSDRENELRLKPYHRLDIRIDRFFNYEWGYGNVFFEALNIYLRDNPGGLSWDNRRPYSATNPQISAEFGNLVIPAGDKEGTRVPLFNFGVEVMF